ncbi:MAG: hypothetical protein E7425_10190 [Ruminococcaceae bacterium]|jgi:hypothetical protein|nr:hypothetical protein [Oscillospiraceae bacterium]
MEENRQPTDEQWDAVEALIPLLRREKTWEVSRNRHHQRCLWDREEDAPYALEDALRALRAALEMPLSDYALTQAQRAALEMLLGAAPCDGRGGVQDHGEGGGSDV